jgi:SAM-dependent methyltransferase
MKEEYEDAYALIEEEHPWFVAKRALFSELIALPKDARILDVGCGTGMFLTDLKRQGFTNLAGVEPSERLRLKFRDATIPVHEEIPAGEIFDAVFMLDVLEHIADDVGALAQVYDLLRPHGRFLMSVPAHPFLWGPHDDSNEHERRYRKGEVREKLTKAGFEIDRLTYWNMFCFPVVCIVRWLAIGKGKESGDLELGPALALKVYGWILQLENRLLLWFKLPVGISLIATAGISQKRSKGAAGTVRPDLLNS